MGKNPANVKFLGMLFLGLACGICGETLMFMRLQCLQVETSLLDDFRVLAFLDTDLPESKGKVLEEKSRAMRGVAQARYISRDAALAMLRAEDPDLMKSVALLGENPLNPVLEIRPAAEVVADWPSWIDSMSKLPGVAETQFKPMELAAITQARLFRRFLNVVLSLAAFFWCLGAAAGLWALIERKEIRRPIEELRERFGFSAVGTLAGMGLVYLASRPFQAVGSSWSWPSLPEQVLLAFAGALGAGLMLEWNLLLAKKAGHHSSGSHSHGGGDSGNTEVLSDEQPAACESREIEA